MDDLKERFLEFIKYCGVSIREFEKTCSITNGTIGSIKAQGPTASVLKKISDAYPELDMNWIITGRGNMLLGDAPVDIPGCIPQNDIHHNTTVNINYTILKDVIKEAIIESRP